jgi:ketosteroid isomerase-like protein
MRRSRFVWIFVCSLVLSAAPVDSKGDKEVLAAMDAFKDAMIHKDGAALGKLLAEDLTYTHSGGQFETKADVIKSITSGKTIVERLDFAETTVRFYGNTALVKGKVDLWHSKTNIVHMNVLHVWVKGAQGWQMVARQATRLAP